MHLKVSQEIQHLEGGETKLVSRHKATSVYFFLILFFQHKVYILIFHNFHVRIFTEQMKISTLI